MHVLVVNNLIGARNILIEANHRESLLPVMAEVACELRNVLSLPLRRVESFHALFIMGGENDEGRACFQPHAGKTSGENAAHLLKLSSYATPVASGAIREHHKVRAAHFCPRAQTSATAGS